MCAPSPSLSLPSITVDEVNAAADEERLLLDVREPKNLRSRAGNGRT